MKFGIALRLAMLLVLGGMLMAGLTGYYAYDASRELLVKSAKNDLLSSAQLLARRISLTRQEVGRHLHVLANHPAALAVLQSRDPRREAELAELFRLIMEASPGYFQVRLIAADDNGMERVRVDRKNRSTLRVTGDDLQEKGHFAYVFDTLALPAGKVYLSRIAINHERGGHAGFDQPNVLLATPVVDRSGVALGVVVINLDLNGIFPQFREDLPGSYQLFLANRDGDYLIHPDESQVFGFDRGRRVLVQDEFPATRLLVAGQAGHVLVEASAGSHATTPMLAAFIRMKVSMATDESQLVLGLAQPVAEVLRQADLLGETMLKIVVAICFACIFVAALLARAITRPINALSVAVQHFGDAKLTDKLPIQRNDEIGVLARSFNRMREQINEQLVDLEGSRRQLEYQAQHDALTGLPNRALFADRVETAIAVARREDFRLALMFIDLDNFKPVNDNLGHAVGDRLLTAIARCLHDEIRESDTAARIGGDEFVVLLRRIQGRDDALAVAEKVRHAIAKPQIIDGQEIRISASIGIAIYPDHGTDLRELSKHADEAMYRSKEQGRDTVRFYDP